MRISSIKRLIALLLSVMLCLNSTGSILADELWTSEADSFVGFADFVSFDTEEDLTDSPDASNETGLPMPELEEPFEDGGSSLSFSSEPAQETALPGITIPFDEEIVSEADFPEEPAADTLTEGYFDAEIADDALEDVPLTMEASEDLFPDSLSMDTLVEMAEETGFSGSETIDGVTVTVTAEEGVFPKDAHLQVEKASAEEEVFLSAALEEARSAGAKVASSHTFDIKIVNPETGEIYQPADGKSALVSFALAEAGSKNLTPNVYHLTEEDGLYRAEELSLLSDFQEDISDDAFVEAGEKAPGFVTIEAKSFSYYTVEFTYGDLQYILEGDSSVNLSEILSAVGLEGEVTSAEVSDPALLSVNKETGEWVVTALEAFTTREWMKVTIDGVTYEIALTDAVAATSVKSWSELQTAINQAGSGQAIRLTANLNGSGKDYLNVQDKTITIDLNGYTIDRKRTSSDGDGHVFWVRNKSTLTITDSRGGGIITGGYATRGGGIHIDATSKCIINGGSISGNKASDGGGIFVRGVLEMNGGSIMNNEASSTGGGIYVEDTGTMQIENAEILLNKASDDGGAIRLHLKSDASINNCTMSGNHSSDKGGAINMDASGKTLTITNTKIEQNDSKDDGGGIYLHAGTIKMTGGSLSNNTSNNDSGGAKVMGKTTFSAENVTMSGNKAIWEEGGAIKNYGTTTLTKCTLKGNTARKQGGAIFNDRDSDQATLTLINTTVTANYSASNGGGIYTDDTLQIKGGSFTKNSSGDKGGAIYVGSDALSTSIEGDLVITDNMAEAGNNVYLKKDKLLTVSGALGTSAKIGLNTEKTFGMVVSAFFNYHADGNPASYFFSDKGLNVGIGATLTHKNLYIYSLWDFIQTQLDAAKDGDVITLTDDCSATPQNDRLQVKGKKSITLDLNGYTLNRNRTSSDDDGHVIEIFDDATLTIIDSSEKKAGIITGGYAKNGGAINIHAKGAAVLKGITLTQNKASYGGAILVHGHLDMEDCTLSYNEASHTGGAIFVSESGDFALTRCTITENASEDSGGAFELKGKNSSIVGCEITKNSSYSGYGGALRLNASGKVLTITDTDLTGNNSSDDGGAIYLEAGTINVTGGEISGNTSNNDGGGVKITHNTTFKATGVTFDGNTASSEEGGAIKTFGTTTLENCTVSNNTSAKQGGGIFNDNGEKGHGTLTLTGTTIKDNHSSSEAGGIYSDDQLIIEGGAITGNSADKRGGGIFVGKDSDYAKISGGLVVEGNRATVTGDNVFLREGKTLTIDTALPESANIGVEKEDNDKPFTTDYLKHHKDTDPSLYFFASEGKEVVLSEGGEAILASGWPALRSEIKNASNKSTITLTQDYGASKKDDRFLVEGGKTITIDLAGHTLNRNLTSSDEDGHIFEVKGNSTLILTDSVGGGKLTGGYANNGGAINVHEGSKCTATGITFTGNKADSSGGAICTRGSLELTNCVITGNEAGSTGGAIFVDDSGTFKLTNVTITGNMAKDDGGALRIHLKSDASITGCTIVSNTSKDKGGAINMDAKNKTLTITDTKIESNTSTDDGGGIYLHNGTINMTGGSLSLNSSSNDGGGAKITSKCTFTATNVTMKENAATTEEGGAIKNFGTTTLTGCTVTGNRATKQGGGVFNDNDGDSPGTLKLINCTFKDNYSESKGGGVYSDDKLEIDGGSFTENEALEKGGGIYVGSDSDYAKICGVLVVEKNTAGFGKDFYLSGGEILTLSGPLAKEALVSFALEDGKGTVTKDYGTYHKEDDPATYFSSSYDMVLEKGEVLVKTSWNTLRNTLKDKNTKEVVLDADYTASSSDDRLLIEKGQEVVLDLNGHTLNRNRSSSDGDGHVIEVKGKLTLKDSKGGGTLTGGYATRGGGINVGEDGILIMEGGTITGNKAEDGGGIYASGTVTISGGKISYNSSLGSSGDAGGGAIYLAKKGALNLYGGEIMKNTTSKYGSIYVSSNATMSVHGSPVVMDNANNEIYLSGNRVITVDGPLDGATLYVATTRETGAITSGYSSFHAGIDPATFFTSTEGYDVTLRGKEVQLSLQGVGGAEYADAFLDWKDQVNTNVKSLSGSNWMSGISGERYLYEINLPGTHDSGMNNVQNIILFDSSDWFSFFVPGAGAFFARTQDRYIDNQLEDGVRRLDLRLKHKYKTTTVGFGTLRDDGKSLWICHGKVSGMGTYYAKDHDDIRLSLDTVLSWVRDFLTKHPTETLILSITAESPDASDRSTILNRAAKILTKFSREINPSTGESFVYQDKNSARFPSRLSYIPQLKECRGQVVINIQADGVDVSCGKFNANMNGIAYGGDLNYKLTKEDKVDEVREYYQTLRTKYANPMIPANAESHLNLYWVAAINCTGQDDGWGYATNFDNPLDLSRYVNGKLFGSGKVYDPNQAGQYIGLVSMDGEKPEYARTIWQTNFFNGLEYRTITVKSNLSSAEKYPVQTYQVLKGTHITIPECIYKGTDGAFFRDWSATVAGDTTTLSPGTEYVVSDDVTFSANWLSENETPVQVIWKDGDDADGLRCDKLTLQASTIGTEEQTYTAYLTDDQGWKNVLNGNVYDVALEWDSVIVSTNDHPYGSDAAGQYRYEAQLDGENGWVITLYHTPSAMTSLAGTVTWEDDENRDGIRPDSITVRLLADGEAIGLSTTVSGDGTYSFNNLAKYKNGEEILYTVEADEAGSYSVLVEDMAITCSYKPSTYSTLAFVHWEDQDNALGLRPERVTIYVQAKGENGIAQTVNQENNWYWMFEDLPLNRRGGGILTYTFTAEEVPGYALTVQEHEEGYEFIYSLDKLSITFEAGEEASGTMDKVSVDKGATYTLPEAAFTAPEGKSFKEWSVKIGEEEAKAMKVGDTITAEANTTVTAVWDALIPSFKTHSLILTGLIGVNFYLSLPEIEGIDYSSSYMEFTVSGKGGQTTQDTFDPQDKNASGEYYGFTCYVSSIQMADTITATFHYGKGQSISQTYSVAKYIEAFAGVRDQYDAATVDVVESIADYGHFMQPVLAAANGWQIGGDHAEMTPYTSSLANNESLSALQAAVADHAFTWNVEKSKIAELTFDLTLDSATTLRIFLTPEEEYEGEVSAYIGDGTENVAVRREDGRYVITIPNISAHLLGQKYLIHGEADGEYYATLSALTYLDAVLGIPEYQGNVAMQNAMLALYNYYQAVIAYRSNH